MTAMTEKHSDFELQVREDLDAILYSTNDTSVIARRLGFVSKDAMYRRLTRAGMTDVIARIKSAGDEQFDLLRLFHHSDRRAGRL